MGRALDHLFDADRALLVTDLVVAITSEFGVSLAELHNDSTTVSFCGQYAKATGRSIRGKKAPYITYGYNKDHRPDLKQLPFVLTTSSDGSVPVQFRCEDGNTSDAKTHKETWDALKRATGRPDFLYVADSKLCTREQMDHIHYRGGRFICVMPKSRQEDEEFREWIQDHEPDWQLVIDRPNPRKHDGPKDQWSTYRMSLPSREGWPVVWVNSTLLALQQEHRRREAIAKAVQELEDLSKRLRGPRPRLRARHEIWQRVEEILKTCKVTRYLNVKLAKKEHHTFKQARPGRPGPNTQYVRTTKKRWHLSWQIDDDAIEYDRASDGMFPLLTNDRTLTDAQILLAHKRQPEIEKRFQQSKTVFEMAPALLKNEGRIEALFFLYFAALLVQALIERELRQAMARDNLDHLPLYPEERATQHPTAEQVFKLFSLVQRHTLTEDGNEVRTFQADLTDLQRQVLGLLGVPEEAYRQAL